jgi:putative FmdB family regulatory protein
MPIYEYRCGTCEDRVAVLVRSGGASPACPDCGSPLTDKLFSAPNIIMARSRTSPPSHCQKPDHECCSQSERGGRLPCSEEGGCMCQN